MHTHLEQWAANTAALGEQLGVWCLAQGSHLSRGQFLLELRFEPTTSGYKSNALSIRPRMPPQARPLSKAVNPQLLPRCRSNMAAHSSGCVFTVCVYALGWVECRAQIPSMGHHTWPHITSLSLNSFMPGCPDCLLNEGQFKAGFVKKLKLKDGSLPQKGEAGWAMVISM